MLRHVGSGFPNFPRQVCPALVRARQVQIGSINYIRPQCRILRDNALLDSFEAKACGRGPVLPVVLSLQARYVGCHILW